jgi:hypothetical protein
MIGAVEPTEDERVVLPGTCRYCVSQFESAKNTGNQELTAPICEISWDKGNINSTKWMCKTRFRARS